MADWKFLVRVNQLFKPVIFFLPFCYPGVIEKVFQLELFKKFRSLAEIRRVFRHVYARLGIKIPESLEYLRPDDIRPGPVGIIRRIHRRVLQLFPEQGINIFAVPLQFQKPGHVVNPRHPVRNLIFGDTHIPGQFGGRALHAVAQTDILDSGVIADSPGDNRHRIGIIHQPGIRADFFHIAADFQNGRNMTRCVKYSTGPESITDTLVNPVFRGNLAVGMGPLRSSDRYCHKDIIGAFQRFTAAGGGLNFGIKALLLHQFPGKGSDWV